MPQLEELVRIELKGLSAEHQLRLLQARFGVIERGRFEIHEREGGGQELVSVERPGEVALPLPSTLEQLIADRLNELPTEEQAIVEWLAVAGGPLGTDDLLALEGADTEDAVMRL